MNKRDGEDDDSDDKGVSRSKGPSPLPVPQRQSAPNATVGIPRPTQKKNSAPPDMVTIRFSFVVFVVFQNISPICLLPLESVSYGVSCISVVLLARRYC